MLQEVSLCSLAQEVSLKGTPVVHGADLSNTTQSYVASHLFLSDKP